MQISVCKNKSRRVCKSILKHLFTFDVKDLTSDDSTPTDKTPVSFDTLQGLFSCYI